jgi:hypothetical protein
MSSASESAQARLGVDMRRERIRYALVQVEGPAFSDFLVVVRE